MKISDPDLKIERRANQLFEVQRRSVYKDTDRMFAFLMGIQWAAGVIASMTLTPKSWVGTTSSVSNNVWAALFLGGAVSAFPIALALLQPGGAATRYTIAVAQMLMASLLIHISGGRIETHFHIFGSLAFLSFYRDWRLLIPATAVVAVDHLTRGLFWPQSIYGLGTIDEWRWLEHAGWVVFEDIFLIVAINRSVREMWNIAMRSAAIRDLNEGLEQRVHKRTAELANSNASLEIELAHRRRLQAESQIVSEIAHFSSRSRDGKELLDLSDRLTDEMLNADRFYIALSDPKTETLRMSYYRDSANRPPSTYDLFGGLASIAITAGRATLFDQYGVRQLKDGEEIKCEEPLPASWLGVPIVSPKKVIGVLVVERYEGEAFTSDDARLLTLVCHQIALSIERKAAEEFRRESEERFRDLFDNAPIAYHEIDREGRYVRVNRTEERLLGYTSEELKGKHVSDLIVGKHARAAITAKMEGRAKLQSVELKFKRKDGRHIAVLTEDRLIRDEAGEVTGIRTTLQDITALKILEEQVMRGQKLESIGQLAAGIAHEINTPTQFVGDNVRFLRDSFNDLRAVVDKAEALASECRGNGILQETVQAVDEIMKRADMGFLASEVPKSLDEALSGIARISKIVQSMKDFAHPGDGVKVAANLNRAIESTITVASNEWKYVADVATNLDPILSPVPCHIGEVNQVVLNMIINAAHSIEDVVGTSGVSKGKITISTKEIDGWAEIRIADTGKGIKPHIKEKVFDPFFTTKEVGKGTGQGLAIAHNIIVGKHNGTIDIETKLGRGTTFVVRLPIVETSLDLEKA